MQDQSSATHELDHQEELAAMLVTNQGLDGAIRSCQAFNWEGVLDLLKTSVPEGASRVGQALK